MNIKNKVWQILADIETFADDKTDSIADSVKLTALSSVVLAIVSVVEIFGPEGPSLTGLPVARLRELYGAQTGSAIIFFGVIAGSAAFLLVCGAVLHFFAFILGAKKEYKNTVSAMVAFLVPNLLFGWVPFVNIWTSIYTFLIIVYVLAKKQDLTMAKATVAIALPIIILTAIANFSGKMGAGGMVQTLVPVPGF